MRVTDRLRSQFRALHTVTLKLPRFSKPSLAATAAAPSPAPVFRLLARNALTFIFRARRCWLEFVSNSALTECSRNMENFLPFQFTVELFVSKP